MNKYKLFSLLTLISVMTTGASMAKEQSYSSISSSAPPSSSVSSTTAPADVTLTVTYQGEDDSYSISGSKQKLILKKGQEWTVAVNNPKRLNYIKNGFQPYIAYNLNLDRLDPMGEYACNEEAYLDTENGDSLIFHFIAATPGSQTVTFQVINELDPHASLWNDAGAKWNEWIAVLHQLSKINQSIIDQNYQPPTPTPSINVEVQE